VLAQTPCGFGVLAFAHDASMPFVERSLKNTGPHPLPLSRLRERGEGRLPLSRLRERVGEPRP
jgi:hypothetical protein